MDSATHLWINFTHSMYIAMLISPILLKIPLQWNYRTKNRLLHWRNSPLHRKPHFPQWIQKCRAFVAARPIPTRSIPHLQQRLSGSVMVRLSVPAAGPRRSERPVLFATIDVTIIKRIIPQSILQIQTISHCVIEGRSKLCGVKTTRRCLSQSENTKHLRWNHESQEMLRYYCRVIDWYLISLVPKKISVGSNSFSIFFCLVLSIVREKAFSSSSLEKNRIITIVNVVMEQIWNESELEDWDGWNDYFGGLTLRVCIDFWNGCVCFGIRLSNIIQIQYTIVFTKLKWVNQTDR